MMQSAWIEYRTAAAQDLPALRENWRLAFGDDDAYLDFFFARRFDPQKTPVALIGGRVVSQLFLLPASLIAGTGAYPVYYLFAAATHPQYRGRGLMAKLLREAERMARADGMRGIVLLPGEPGLYRYYAQHGYETAFTRRVWTATRAQLAAIAAQAPQTDALPFLLRYFPKREGLCWDADALTYALEEHRRFRGKWAATADAFVSVGEDEAHCLCRPADFPLAAGLLLRLTDSSNLTIRCPADIPYGEVQDGGMIRFLGERIALQKAYISFAME